MNNNELKEWITFFQEYLELCKKKKAHFESLRLEFLCKLIEPAIIETEKEIKKLQPLIDSTWEGSQRTGTIKVPKRDEP